MNVKTNDTKILLENIQKMQPRIHSITNTITINDCANIVLAAGGHPTMASDPRESAEMTSHCNGLVLNLGAVSSLSAMLASGREANRLGLPVVFDPVAAGATLLRRTASMELMEQIHFTAIRGNASEIHALAALLQKQESSQSITEAFVDADEEQTMQQKNLTACRHSARLLSRALDTIVIVSGIDDLVVRADNEEIICGGDALSARITGSGCMLTELICVCIAANPGNEWNAVCAAVRSMNSVAEKAARKTWTAGVGTMSFRMYLIDEISKNEAF